jgi:predicted amidohydrolase YtcJ
LRFGLDHCYKIKIILYYTSLSLEECLKGMTIWAAFASFDEGRLGSIEAGKEATFVIFEKPVDANEVYNENFAWKTFIKGRKVYEQGEL